MDDNIIDAKKQSRFNLTWWLAPIVAFGLLFSGDFLGILGFMWLPFAMPNLFSNAYFILLVELFGFAFISLVVILWARKVEKSPWQGLGLTKTHALKDFLKGWVFGAGMLIICVLIMMALGAVTISGIDFSMKTCLAFIPLILAWSVQGTTEEILCRGWLFPSIGAKTNIPVAILVSSLFFTVIHLGNDGISLIPLLDLTFFAVLACLCVLKTNTLWVISGLHAAWNCFQGNVFAFPVSGTNSGNAFIHVQTQGPDWLSGGPFGVEGSIVSVLVQGVVVVWLTYDLFFKKQAKYGCHSSK